MKPRNARHPGRRPEEIARALPGDAQGAHAGHPDFRIRKGRIGATLWPTPKAGAWRILTPEQQAGFLADDAPACSVPSRADGARRGCAHVTPKNAGKRAVKIALAEAMAQRCPAKVVEAAERG